MTRPMRADARRNYERLISTARAAFLEHGTDASLDDIAKRAGVGSGTLYRHFPTRDDLLHAVLEDWIEGLLGQARDLVESDSPADALATWLRTYLAGVSTQKGTSTVLIGVMSSPWGATSLGGSSAAICEATERLLTRAQATGRVRPDVDARDVVRIANAVGIAAERTAAPAENASRMLSVFLDGLRHAPGPDDPPL
ncbi:MULTISPECIES: TetR/AcrR family transcriptional regulator [Thermomonosporaceae]|uniref:TetR/AcrR family transcriptional regulator n=1 Tax=Thermomonosporaceae TaxID=2012 RepID=UPI00255ACDEB|nr:MULTISPECIES: TetR/AcrR family transcriptional regulator [Thermomonosporaceae]MDL4771541.1 TetR/AcrR family transcriptional regulator [Actinomadura xylanilytica]